MEREMIGAWDINERNTPTVKPREPATTKKDAGTTKGGIPIFVRKPIPGK